MTNMDTTSLLAMARNLSVRCNAAEMTIFRPSGRNFNDKQLWVVNELSRRGYHIQLEIPAGNVRALKQQAKLNNQ